MSPVEIARFLGLTKKNRWSGILLLDGKYIRKGCLLILAVDYVTLDIIAWIVVEAETEENYTKLVDLVEQCGYHIKALISDGHPAITSLTTPKKQFVPKGTRRYPRPGTTAKAPLQARLAGIPHQWCCVHAERELKALIAKKTKGTGKNNEELLSFIHTILFAKTIIQAERIQQQFVLTAHQTHNILYQQVASWLFSHWDMLTLHHELRINRRKIPRDSNCVENVISYVNVRLKTMKKLTNQRVSSANYQPHSGKLPHQTFEKYPKQTKKRKITFGSCWKPKTSPRMDKTYEKIMLLNERCPKLKVKLTCSN